jgi:hypothetical protein
MLSKAAWTRAALSWSASVTMSRSTVGTTCQDKPYLSVSQPQATSWRFGQPVPVVIDLGLVGRLRVGTECRVADATAALSCPALR